MSLLSEVTKNSKEAGYMAVGQIPIWYLFGDEIPGFAYYLFNF